MNYTLNINEYLSKFYKGTKTPTLDAMLFFMEKLGHPEKKIKVVHIAGTNGKGSTCEMLSTVLEKAGYKVGEFMSPHIIRFNERIRINHKEILDEELEELLEIIAPFVDEYNETHEEEVTLFEVETAIALLYFARKECDIVVLETGLGGLYDCTNIVDPILSIITSIGYDHMNILGNTLEEIAIQKAGIIKENSETIYIKHKSEIDAIIKKTCEEKNNILHLINPKDWTNNQSKEKQKMYGYKEEQDITQKEQYKINNCKEEYQIFNYKERKNIQINLKGNKQIANACIVLEAIDVLENKGYMVSDEDLREGLKTVVHKARFETIYTNPTIIFDGGHNEDAIKNLKETIKAHYSNAKKIYIVSILKTKDYKTVIKELMEDKDAIFIFTDGTKVQDEVKCYVPKEELYKEALKYKSDQVYMSLLEEAVQNVRKNYKDAVTFVIGSFYTYSEVIEFLKK